MVFYYANVSAKCEIITSERILLSPQFVNDQFYLVVQNTQNAGKESQGNREKEPSYRILLWSPGLLEAQDARRRVCAKAETPPLAGVRDPWNLSEIFVE